MDEHNLKDTTEETDVALEIAEEAGRRGIPKREQNGTFSGESFPETIADYFMIEGAAAGLNARVPPFYSRARDEFLRNIVVNSDGFLIAIYNVLTKVVSLVPTISALDKENDDEVFAAKVSNELLRKCWIREMLMAIFDLFTQDNGMHIELLDGTTRPSRPLEPYDLGNGVSIPCIGIKHWDSQRVKRTGHPTYPVIVTGMNGKEYKVHKTRMISFTDMPSAKATHYGVGLCAASRVLVNLMQMIESEEIVGDMLFDGLVGEIIFGQPFSSTQLQEAFRKAEQRSQTHNEPRYRRFVYVGIQNPNPGSKFQVERIPLRRLPEGYKKSEAITLFMYLVAAALGVDAREVFPATVSGATRADADVQHRKAQNKFTRLFINFMTNELEMKFAPMNTKVTFDFTDTAEELEKAEARKALSESHQIELLNGTITREVATEQLHEAGYLTQDQLEDVLDQPPLIDQFGNTILPGQRVTVVSGSANNGQLTTNQQTPNARDGQFGET